MFSILQSYLILNILITPSNTHKIYNVELRQIIIILFLQVMKYQTTVILVSLNNEQYFCLIFFTCITQYYVLVHLEIKLNVLIV